MGNHKDSSRPCWLTLGRNILCLQVQVEIDLASEIYACKLNVAKLVHNSLRCCQSHPCSQVTRCTKRSGLIGSCSPPTFGTGQFHIFTDCNNFIHLCISIAHHSRSDGELRAIAEDFAYDNGKFVKTVVAAWDKLTTADRWARVDYVLNFLQILSSFSRYLFNAWGIYGVFRFLGPAENVCDQPESRVRLPNSNVHQPGSIP